MQQSTSLELAENARLSTYMGSIAVADLMKSTLGPFGSDKLLLSRRHNKSSFQISNDGATILSALTIDNPAAHILVDLSRSQDRACGDGTTSVAVLTGELLRSADSLLESGYNITDLIKHFRLYLKQSLKVLEDISFPLSSADSSGKGIDLISENREVLLQLVKNILSSKILAEYKEHFSNIIIDLLENTIEDNYSTIKIVLVEGADLSCSYLESGLLLPSPLTNTSTSTVMENKKMLLANTPMNQDKLKLSNMVATDNLQDIRKEEESKINNKLNIIRESGAEIFVNRQLIYDYQFQELLQEDIFVVENIDFEGVEKLHHFYKAPVVTSFINSVDSSSLSVIRSLGGVKIGQNNFLKFEREENNKVTLVLRGNNKEILDEAKRAVEDAVTVVKNLVSGREKLICEGGAFEMAASYHLSKGDNLQKEGIRKGVGRAFAAVAEVLSRNAGLDGPELVNKAIEKFEKGEMQPGRASLDLDRGRIVDGKETGRVGSMHVKEGVVRRAMEACEAIMRVDGVVVCPGRERGEDDDGCGH